MKVLIAVLVIGLCSCSKAGKYKDATVEVYCGNAMGTGVIDKQRIITCAHVVSGFTTNPVTIRLTKDGQDILCGVEYFNAVNDVAILRPTKLLPDFSWERGRVKVHSMVWSYGNTFGMSKVYAHGYVAHLYSGTLGDRYVIAMPVGKGSSGAPVYCNGKLVALVSAMGSSNHAICIPIYLVPE